MTVTRTETASRLQDMGFLPSPTGRLPLRTSSKIRYRTRYRGTLLGVAIGDALGRPAEGASPALIKSRYGVLDNFRKWRGWQRGPIGTITDDTQMTMCITRTYLKRGTLDPDDLASRFAEWLSYGRGKGSTCTRACQNLVNGARWWESGVESAGNGAAMRAAAVGLANPTSVDGIRFDGTLSAVITHRDGMAAASAVALAYAVASLLNTTPTTFETRAFVDGIVHAIVDLPDQGHPERRPGTDDRRVRLVDRIAEVPGLLHLERDDAFSRLHNGAFVLESLPAALWAFLKWHDNPEDAVIGAVNGGYDADTVGAMTGAMAGALHGDARWPDRWIDELEYREEITSQADAMYQKFLVPARIADGTRGWGEFE